jgi:hypothetical protein
MTLISVCMRNYNYGHVLARAIQSVLNQTCADFELVIVDDCSTDNSAEVAGAFTDKRLKFHQNAQRIGSVANLNRCLDLARGDYICILDSDDVLLPRSLETRARVLDNHADVGFVFSGLEVVDGEGSTAREFVPFDGPHIVDGQVEFRHLAILGNYVYWQTAMFRKELCDRLGRFDETIDYSSAWALWLRMCLHGQVAYLPECLARKYEHPHNLSAEFDGTNRAGMEEYRVLSRVFSSLPPHAIHLASLKPLAFRSLAAAMQRRAFRNLCQGQAALARRNVGLAVAVDDSILLDWKSYVIFLASLAGTRAKVMASLPSRLVLRGAGYRGWPRPFPCVDGGWQK